MIKLVIQPERLSYWEVMRVLRAAIRLLMVLYRNERARIRATREYEGSTPGV